MTTLEHLLRRRSRANRLSRWVALLFFGIATFFYAIDSDIAKFLLPVRTLSFFGLLISGVLFLIQYIEYRRFPTGPPVVVITGFVLSFALAGYVYLREFAAYRELELSFVNEGTTLAGTLYLPSADGTYPAAIIAQGSVKAPRRLYHVWADMLVREGIAVFSFDKRGTGDSGGTYEAENNSSVGNLSLLASDVAAAVRTVRGHPEIDPLAVGIVGVSMGGWTAPIAADSLGSVAFMVLLSGPTVSVGEENYFSDLTGEGHRTGAGLPDDSVNALMAAREPSGFDPRGILRRLSVPSMWLFGEGDLSIPVPKSIAVLDSLIVQSQRPYQYRVYPEANHLLVLPYWPYDFPADLRKGLAAFILTTVRRASGGGQDNRGLEGDEAHDAASYRSVPG